ncbi:MAG: hypothetical protein JNL05_07600 [Flavobacteriales bacterium]|nr:hypothetical protein [Flavobacteriales bacterium]
MDPLAWFAHMLNTYLQHKRADAQDRRTDLGFKQRALHHRDIPPTHEVERLMGARFEELLGLFVQHDPLVLHTRRSRSGADQKHAEHVRRTYRSLTRTYGFRIMRITDPDQLRAALRVELSLWFGSATYGFLNEDDPEALMPELIRWRSRWEFR